MLDKHKTFYIRTDFHNRRDVLNLRRIYGDIAYGWLMIIISFMNTLEGQSIKKEYKDALFINTDCPAKDTDKFFNMLLEFGFITETDTAYELSVNPNEAPGNKRHKYPEMSLEKKENE